jgi:hypothetical protein
MSMVVLVDRDVMAVSRDRNREQVLDSMAILTGKQLVPFLGHPSGLLTSKKTRT